MDELLKPIQIQTRPPTFTSSLPHTLSLSLSGNTPGPGLGGGDHDEPLLTVSSTTKFRRPGHVLSAAAPAAAASGASLVPVSEAEVLGLRREIGSGIEIGTGIEPVEVEVEVEVEVTSQQDALVHLRGEPSLGQLRRVLEYLTSSDDGGDAGVLGIHVPTATSSQIVKVLVDEVVPQFWPVLGKGRGERGGMVRCLRSVVGVGGLVGRLGVVVGGDGGDGLERAGAGAGAGVYMEVLGKVLGRTTVLWEVWRGVVMGAGVGVKGEILWKEWLGLVAGGKVLGVASAARGGGRGDGEGEGGQEEGAGSGEAKINDGEWVGDGKVYAQWLGKGVGVMAERLSAMAGEEGKEGSVEMGWKCLRMLFWRSFGLGGSCWDEIVESATIHLMHPIPRWETLSQLLLPSSPHDKSRYLTSLLRVLSREYLDSTPPEPIAQWWESDASVIARVAGAINGVARLDPGFWNVLVEWVHGSGGVGVGEGIGIRRAVMAVLSKEVKGPLGVQGGPQELRKVLERSLKNFGDGLWIKHTPIQVQEGNIQTILLCVGYLYRVNPAALKAVVQSSVYLSGISNRLATQSPRARFLGMVVGEAVSGLMDEKGMKLDFKMEELGSVEAGWWKGLVGVEDRVGDVDGLGRVGQDSSSGMVARKRIIGLEDMKEGMDEEEYVVEIVKGSVEEVVDEKMEASGGSSDDDEDEEDEFKPYPKPDSDPEDEDDEDPTLVNRNKTPPPVYIRDLLRLLRSHDNYDHQVLALTHAAALIRRKEGFGTELAEHLHELATSLAGLQDKFDIEGFQEMRTRALIALVVARPVEMGRWIARAFFEGEFSVGGRAVLLTAVGMGARELGGFKDGDTERGGESGKGVLGLGAPEMVTGPDGKLFPSEMLPRKLHELYSPSQQSKAVPSPSSISRKQLTATTSPIDALTTSLQKAMIHPLAATAADTLSGPNILKVRTFSSRMAVQAKRAKPSANKLSPIVGTAFFYPLTARWWAKLREFGPRAPQFNPVLLAHLLKTLALVLHAAGPACPQLPDLTREFWDLLLGLRGKSGVGGAGGLGVEDADGPSVVEAVLFALLTVLELNMDSGEAGRRRLVEEHARELVETGEWVEGVFEGASGGGSNGGMGVGGTGVEEDRVRMLAAAVVLRVRECGEGYERRLRGELGRWE